MSDVIDIGYFLFACFPWSDYALFVFYGWTYSEVVDRIVDREYNSTAVLTIVEADGVL